MKVVQCPWCLGHGKGWVEPYIGEDVWSCKWCNSYIEAGDFGKGPDPVSIRTRRERERMERERDEIYKTP